MQVAVLSFFLLGCAAVARSLRAHRGGAERGRSLEDERRPVREEPQVSDGPIATSPMGLWLGCLVARKCRDLSASSRPHMMGL
ncbi:hypothetical protein BDY21DRAFT_332123 [Lineolata rhizophorae]|uniref:Uncharacterized protein n=1 Tax=Lineolata rhizophorae TaxID=578093 RepID=A0A6A6PBV4_9PEZI|nr:hypothetical protein BDY21DRAFT_332123 [Lineolata rhizophorae]